MKIVVTGAGGFLGQAIVKAARAQGCAVRAVVRNTVPASWEGDPQIEVQRCDLAESADLGELGPEDAVIHAAASLGDDAAQARDTTQATANLLAALPAGTRLVLVSSFSVYDYVALADGATLDETAKLETNLDKRDAYTRAKLAQEQAAKRMDLDLRIARPAVIYGAGDRAWTSLVGWKVGPFIVTTSPGAQIPAIHVDDCAAQLVKLATLDTIKGDPVLNLVSPSSPTRRDWIKAMGLTPLALPKGLLFGCSKLFGAILPNGLGLPKLAARFKPLRYDAAPAEAILGPLPDRDALVAMKEPT